MGTNFLRFVLVFIAILLVATFFKVFLADDESTLDVLCRCNLTSLGDWLLLPLESNKGLFHEHGFEAVYSVPLISYLARHEKSPPFIIPVSICS